MTNKLSEKIKIGAAITPADDHSAAQASVVYMSVAGYRQILGFSVSNTLASGKKSTVQLKQATASDGTGSKNLGSSVTGAALQKEVMQAANVEDMDLANGFTFVGVAISSDNAATHLGAGGVILSSGRFSE